MNIIISFNKSILLLTLCIFVTFWYFLILFNVIHRQTCTQKTFSCINHTRASQIILHLTHTVVHKKQIILQTITIHLEQSAQDIKKNVPILPQTQWIVLEKPQTISLIPPIKRQNNRIANENPETNINPKTNQRQIQLTYSN